MLAFALVACDIENHLGGKEDPPAEVASSPSSPSSTTSTSPPLTTTGGTTFGTTDTGTPEGTTPTTPGTDSGTIPIDTALPPLLAACGAPVEAPCSPGASVELGYAIPAIAMQFGASDLTGDGSCCGTVVFGPDLTQVSQLGMMDYTTFTVVSADYNGWGEGGCGQPHCQDLTYGDGRVRTDYCTIVALCEDGVARATGYTW